jgi:two-component system chemotaxis response regulator CheB
MSEKKIIVIGASAGGFQALKTLIAGLPKDLDASIFIVWHMAPDTRGVLPQVFNRYDTVPATQAYDRQPIEPGNIYVAPPDRHLLIEDRRIRVTRGPKENRFRPAIDPLFRSAAFYFGPNVIGIVLSGALDDGTSGLWTVKHRGGTAMRSMPENAIREVDVDHVVPVAEMPALLTKLMEQKRTQAPARIEEENGKLADQLEAEIKIASEDNALEDVMRLGTLTPYTCPECHGVLSTLKDGALLRFRCHTGHAFTADALLSSLTHNLEESIWTAIRGVDESIIFLNHMGDHYAEENRPKLAALFFKKANEAQHRNELLRNAVLEHDQMSTSSLQQEIEDAGGEAGSGTAH